MTFCLLLLIAAGTLFTADAARSSGETSTQPVTQTLVWPDDTRYVGTVLDGKRSGKGTITWQNDTRFVGHFKDDLKNGPGTLVLPDGSDYSDYVENAILADHQPVAAQANTPAQHPAEMTETTAEISTEQLTEKPATTSPTTIPPEPEENVGQYLANYAAERAVPDEQIRSLWNALRRSRLQAPKFIEVALADLDYGIIQLDEARINFAQTYRSKRYNDVSSKFVQFKKQDNTWFIINEGNR